jgi:ribonuclease E
MEEGNSLKSLDIRGCGQILIKHISSWVRKAAKNNWELSVNPKVPLSCVEHSDSDDSDSEEGFELLNFFLAGFIHDMLDSDDDDDDDDDEDIEVEEDSDEDQNWNESDEESEGVEDDDDVMEF